MTHHITDWKNPDADYVRILGERQQRLQQLSTDPNLLTAVKVHYANAPWDFISDWGMTFDPRRLEDGQIANMPFILMPRQIEFVQWIEDSWRNKRRGLAEKSRDCGATWCAVGWAVSKWCLYDNMAIGFGSRKEEFVDKIGKPGCIFEKIRHFVKNLPPIFLPRGFVYERDALFMRLVSPETNSSITGEAGNNIGRGDRQAAYFVDETAFIEDQESIEKSLSATTNCRIDVSTFNGPGNRFYQNWQKFRGTERHFPIDWREDLRKDEAWYRRQLEEMTPETVAQEIDRDPLASNTDAFIPALWVNAAIDAHKLLNFEPSGIRVTFFDPADVGDAKAVVTRYGSVITQARTKTTGDITHAIPWAYDEADEQNADVLVYDGDGMGAPTMKLAFQTRAGDRIQVKAYHGSSAVEYPDQIYGGEGHLWNKDREKRAEEAREKLGKANKDTFYNYRAQAWTRVRDRFRATYEAVTRARANELVNVDPEYLISISSECERLQDLVAELSQPKRQHTPNGKIKVESKQDMKKRGVSSPNLADAAIGAMNERRAAVKSARNFQTTPTPRSAWPTEGLVSTGGHSGGWMLN